jgi:predicted alpha/beta hydrolase family esterase
MNKIIIIHGTMGSPSGNWFPWLSSQLSSNDTKVIIPKMPTPENQSLSSWFESYNSKVGMLSSEDIIIGHSLGAVFLLRLLEKSETKIKAGILVSGFTGYLNLADFDKLNSSFIEEQFNWSEIKSKADKIISIHSDKDPYIPMSQSIELSNKLSISSTIIPNAGHLNSESGYDKFPFLLSLVEDILDDN